jgi:hypothetical protein
MKRALTRIALAAALLAPAGAAAVVTAGPAQAACSQNVRTTHSDTEATLTIITRYCDRSYRAWAAFSDGTNHKGIWITSGSSTAYDANGGNIEGGYQYETTGGGPITTHISY